jgi:hypothetical protein
MFINKNQSGEAPKTTVQQIEIDQTEILNETSSKTITILNNLYQIDKEVSTETATWLGIKALQDKQRAIEPYDKDGTIENYSLWKVENGQGMVVELFAVGGCDNIIWDTNKDGGVQLHYMTSPCEAFRINTYITYDSQGKEQFRITHNSSDDSFTFKNNRRPEYKVDLITEGVCEGSISSLHDQFSFPKVALKGVNVTDTYSKEEKEFNLNKAVEIGCGAGYGDTIIDPKIETPTFDSEKIEFTLPNDKKIVISLKAVNYADVEFK